MLLKTFTGSTLFQPEPDRNSRDYALIIVARTELLSYQNLLGVVYFNKE